MNRFSLRALLLAVAFVALAIVATMNANRPWAVAMEVLVYLLLSTAIVGALWTIGERRAFWGGCAVFGWTLWLAGAVSTHVQLPGAKWGQEVTSWLAQIYRPVEVESEEYKKQMRPDLQIVGQYVDSNGVKYFRVHSGQYISSLGKVTGALLVIVAGIIGGAISAWLWRVGRKE